jgi:hypothetical protein
MKTVGVVAILSILAATIVLQAGYITRLREDRNIYRSNTEVLAESVEQYRTKDSMNVASVRQLQLKINEVEKLRAEDIRLIAKLKVDRKRLQQITTVQTASVYQFQVPLEDVVIEQADTVTTPIGDTLHCIKVAERWFSVDGCIDGDNRFTGTFRSIDSLFYVEHIVPRRFLFIKWGCKERRQEIGSRNPNTQVLNAEFITIRK